MHHPSYWRKEGGGAMLGRFSGRGNAQHNPGPGVHCSQDTWEACQGTSVKRGIVKRDSV